MRTRLMGDALQQQAVTEADYLIQHDASLRETAVMFHRGKTTIGTDIHQHLDSDHAQLKREAELRLRAQQNI